MLFEYDQIVSHILIEVLAIEAIDEYDQASKTAMEVSYHMLALLRIIGQRDVQS